MRALITKRLCDSSKPLSCPYEIRDIQVSGLILRVQPSGVKSWNVQWARGKRRSIGKYPVATLEMARVKALQILADAGTNGGTPEIGKRKAAIRTLRDFLDNEYGPWVKTNRKDGDATLARIEAVFADLLDKPLNQVNTWVLEKWRSQRLKEGIKPATANRDRTALFGALTKAVEWDFLAAHPLTKLKPCKVDSTGVVRYLSADEEARLRQALKARDDEARTARIRANTWRAARGYDLYPDVPADGYSDHLTPLVLVALNTGLRRGELTSLAWSDVNGKMLTVQAGYAKSGTARHVPLNREALDVLTRWRRQKPDGRLFEVQSVKKAWAALMVDAGIKNFRFHDLRHAFASKLVMTGADLNTVRELLGHADIKMTLRYAHLAPEHKAAAVERVAGAS